MADRENSDDELREHARSWLRMGVTVEVAELSKQVAHGKPMVITADEATALGIPCATFHRWAAVDGWRGVRVERHCCHYLLHDVLTTLHTRRLAGVGVS